MIETCMLPHSLQREQCIHSHSRRHAESPNACFSVFVKCFGRVHEFTTTGKHPKTLKLIYHNETSRNKCLKIPSNTPEHRNHTERALKHSIAHPNPRKESATHTNSLKQDSFIVFLLFYYHTIISPSSHINKTCKKTSVCTCACMTLAKNSPSLPLTLSSFDS